MDQSQSHSQYPVEETFEVDQYLFRKSDLDDSSELERIISASSVQGLNLLYDYPILLTLLERSYLSITILDQNSNIIGCAIFNDFPQGLTGMIDFKHENFWENWLFQAFDFQDFDHVNSYNKKDKLDLSKKEESRLVEKVFQHVYGTIPRIDHILFLMRGESIKKPEAMQEIMNIMNTLFVEIQCVDRALVQTVMGIHPNSGLYLSPRSTCCDEMEIRLAREEDQDDLAEVFNLQSELLTAQFGEFFIADLIATQNQTRNITKQFASDGKALVAQVGTKAVGLLSLSTEIDYQLLAKNYQLDTYEFLLQGDFMQKVTSHKEQMAYHKQLVIQGESNAKQKHLMQEIMLCKPIGQRMCLQQYCTDMELEIKQQMDTYLSNEEQNKTLTKEIVDKMIDKWMDKFEFNQPSNLFLELECNDHEVMTMIQSQKAFFLEALTFFGLPKDYMKGMGHWKDWEKKILEEKKQQSLRRPMKKTLQKGKKKDDLADMLKPPTYFDLAPLMSAFTKFVAATAENRAQFIIEIENNYKNFITLFTFENGELNDSRCVDLNSMGVDMIKKKNINIPTAICDILSLILECFGDIIPEKKIIQVMPQEDDTKKTGKDAMMKKLQEQLEPLKPIDVEQKITSYSEFNQALQLMKSYDKMLNRLGKTKSMSLSDLVQIDIEREQKALQQEQNAEKERNEAHLADFKDKQEWFSIINEMKEEEIIPNRLPLEAQNAIVINMFCIDENFESRAGDFLSYPFKLFPEKDYMILTQPHTIPEGTLLQNFIQVPAKRESNFDHVLYIVHRDALDIQNGLKVRRSEIDDVQHMELYMNDIDNKEQIRKDMIEAIKENASKKMAFSVYCQDYLIGMYVLSKSVNLDYYISHFCVQDHIILKEHPKNSHTRLLHSLLNPLYAKYSRFILKEILRLTNKSCLYFETHQRTQLPDLFHELYQVRARVFPHFLQQKWDFALEPEFFEKQGDKTDIQDGERDAFDEEGSDFALSMICKKHLSNVKVSNNTRIVVVGASDTGISLIESLLTIKDVKFSNLTLLAPGGLLTMNVKKKTDLLKAISTSYTFEELRNLMLDARVCVLDAKMMTLDKKLKRIGLDKNYNLPYDILLSCVGLIDTQLQNLHNANGTEEEVISTGVYLDSNYIGYKNKQCKLGVYSIDDPYLYKHFQIGARGKKGNIELLKRKKKPQKIMVYGRTLHTFCFINGLLNRGVDPNRIQLVIPRREEEKQTSFKTNNERLEYEVQLIKDPDPFQDEVIENKILDNIRAHGIHIRKDYTLKQIVCDSKGVCEKIILQKPIEEVQAHHEQMLLLQQQQADSANPYFGSGGHQPISHNMPADANEHNQQMEQIRAAQMQPNDSGENSRLEGQEIQFEQDEAVEARFLVTSGIVDIDREIFDIIHENGLVYNGRLIIRNNFQTTEEVIFACGKICEFSQVYKHKAVGTSLRLDKYNGRELGQKLAKSLLDSLDLGYLFNLQDDLIQDDTALPQFYMPVGHCGMLPRNQIYYHIKRQDWFRPSALISQPKNRPDVVCDNLQNDGLNATGQCIKFTFDNNGLIDSVTYLGSQEVNVSSLISFVGLSEKYLNQLRERYNEKLIPNICEFLSENWALCLYHEWFSEFRHMIKNDLLNSDAVNSILDEVSKHIKKGKYVDEAFYDKIKTMLHSNADVLKTIKEGTLEFIRENQNHLPMYYVPNKKV